MYIYDYTHSTTTKLFCQGFQVQSRRRRRGVVGAPVKIGFAIFLLQSSNPFLPALHPQNLFRQVVQQVL